MRRDLQALEDHEFDVVIVGAGIYGAAAAWEAASRGLSAALIDRDDFGAFTSANSLKTVHGGLRYLQTLDVGRVRESVRERSTLLRIVPHLVHPLCCVMPTYGFLMKGRPVMTAGLLVNDLLSFDRNRGLDPEQRIPAGRTVSRGKCLGMIIGISGNRVTGGAVWSDAQMVSSERVLLSFVLSAARAGAVAANHVEAVGFGRVRNRVTAVQARDRLTGREFEIRARTVLNASGGFTDRLVETAIPGVRSNRMRLSTALNLVVGKPLLPGCAAGVTSRFVHVRPDGRRHKGSRVLFFAPWQGVTLVGTQHRPYTGDPDALRVTENEIDTFLEEVQHAYPGGAVRREDVTFWHKGFLPMDGVDPRSGEIRLTKHYRIHDHGRENGVEGLVSVVGVKYTTARDVAEKTVDLLFRKLGRRAAPSVSSRTPLWGGDVQRFARFLEKVRESAPLGLPAEIMTALARAYGSEYPAVLSLVEKDPSLGKPLPGAKRVIGAQIVHAVRDEMACTLADAVRRRTGLGAAGHPGREALAACAALMARELGWDDGRVRAEIAEAEAAYRPSPGGRA